MPKISVLLPVFNAQDYLKECIESILGQSFKDFEFIIINDGSTDGTENIIKSFDDPRIVYVKNETNLRLIETLNKGLNLAKGKYIARMDADDISFPERLQKQYDFMESNPDITASSAACIFFGFRTGADDFPGDFESIKLRLLWGSALVHPLAILRKETIEKYGLKYDEAHLHVEDIKFWYDLSRHGKLANLPEVLLKWRTHSSQITQINRKTGAQATARVLQVQLREAGVEIRETDFTILVNMVNYEYKFSLEEFERVITVFNDYCNRNLINKRHQQELLEKEVILRLFEGVFYNSGLFNLKYWLVFKRASKTNLIPLKKKLRLALKIITGR